MKIDLPKGHNQEIVTVYGDSALPEVIEAPQFQNWIRSFDHMHMDIRSILIQSADIFPTPQGKKVIFVKAEAHVFDRESGKQIPGVVFMRGNAVCIFLMLECIETRQKFIALIKQARVPLGQHNFLELPAGCEDKGDGITGRAIAELEEETGVKITKEDLQFLGEWAPSAGGCDEHLFSFFVRKEIRQKDLQDILKVTHGVEKEGEHIAVRLHTPHELMSFLSRKDTLHDGKILASLAYLLVRENKDETMRLLENL